MLIAPVSGLISLQTGNFAGRTRFSLARAIRALAGLFLKALGIVVLLNAYRSADLMGIFGFIALVVDFASVAILLPHRTRDCGPSRLLKKESSR